MKFTSRANYCSQREPGAWPPASIPSQVRTFHHFVSLGEAHVELTLKDISGLGQVDVKGKDTPGGGDFWAVSTVDWTTWIEFESRKATWCNWTLGS